MKNGKKLRVLHLTTHLEPGGITSYIRLLTGVLGSQGHESTVLSSGGSVREELEQAGVATPVLPIQTKNEFHPKLISAARRTARLAREGGYSVLHAHTRVGQVIGSLASAWSRVPLVTTAHGFFRPKLGRRVFAAWGQRVIAISPSVADDLQKSHGVDGGRIRVVLNAIDQPALERRYVRLNSEEAKRQLGLEGRWPVIASVGRLVEDKGHAHLIAAAGKLKAAYPNIYLLIVGDGRERARLQACLGAARLNAHASIESGSVDLATVYRACDIFAHPATWREGFGLSPAEAMFAQKPVVATRIPALDRLYSDGENALLVPPASAEALERALRYLLEKPKDAERIAQNGARWARTVCAPERFGREIEAVYREVCDGE